MIETIFRFLLEIVLLGVLYVIGRVGYWITRGIVSIAGGSQIFVAPPPNNYVVVTRWHGMHRLTDGTPVISERLASVLGLTVLACVVLIFLIVVKLLRA
jgi:hypothetical protein